MLHATSPTDVIDIVEVLGWAEQGRSRPLKCMGADGYLYYVKGQQTNRSSLWREWICGHLAQALDIRLPPFCLVQLDKTLLRELQAEWQSVGCMPAFASRHQAHSGWMEMGMVGQVPEAVQRDVWLFDWWVQNPDRTRGNTNLLWDTANESLVMIDHNLAFDVGLEPKIFHETHIFAEQRAAFAGDLFLQQEYTARLQAALPIATQAIDSAPSEWGWENAELDVPTAFDREAALSILSRCNTDELWRTV